MHESQASQILTTVDTEVKIKDAIQSADSGPIHIFGVQARGTTALLGVSRLPGSFDQSKNCSGSPIPGCAECWCPGGLSSLAKCLLQEASEEQEAAHLVEQACSRDPLDARGNSIYIVQLKGQLTYWMARNPAERLSFVRESPDALQKWLGKHFCCLRLQQQVFLQIATRKGGQKNSSDVAAAFKSAKSRLRLDLATFVVSPAAAEGWTLLGSQTGNLQMEDSMATMQQPADVKLLTNIHNAASAAPVITYTTHEGGPKVVANVELALDMLCYAPREKVDGQSVTGSFLSGIISQLSAAQSLLQAQLHCRRIAALHFQPDGCNHPMTFLYPEPTDAFGQDESSMLSQRQWLHRKFFLPMDRPLLRDSNALRFESARTSPGGKLQNVHQGVKSSGVRGGQQHLIWGEYTYFHYMQDGLNDNGWGCAYRSLQTLCSWFRHQHMTSEPIPTHKDIQQALVDIGDKERGFVGSRQWIGAIELGFVLETLLGVTAKVITVSKGADVDQRARELADHFDRQGTPVMIGGGVLAYTLLGVDYNSATGDCAYLILDPHYTGSDDLQRIHKGQWVAWKRSNGNASGGGKLFVQDAFYNLLCPQRPLSV